MESSGDSEITANKGKSRFDPFRLNWATPIRDAAAVISGSPDDSI
jgi:hypothetical protein